MGERRRRRRRAPHRRLRGLVIYYPRLDLDLDLDLDLGRDLDHGRDFCCYCSLCAPSHGLDSNPDRRHRGRLFLRALCCCCWCLLLQTFRSAQTLLRMSTTRFPHSRIEQHDPTLDLKEYLSRKGLAAMQLPLRGR